jgi:hypothetical protein
VGCLVACRTDSVDVMASLTGLPARRRFDAPGLALAAATAVIGIAQPPKSMPTLR